MERVNLVLKNQLFKDTLARIDSLESERIFCRHGMDHLLVVARIAYINALENELCIDKERIYTAALLHDIGRATEYENGELHAAAGTRIAEKILSQCDFFNDEKDYILCAISAHNNHDSTNELGELLRSADKLSRNCFCCGAIDKCKWSVQKMNMGIRI